MATHYYTVKVISTRSVLKARKRIMEALDKHGLRYYTSGTDGVYVVCETDMQRAFLIGLVIGVSDVPKPCRLAVTYERAEP